jgi:hypothetical protein
VNARPGRILTGALWLLLFGVVPSHQVQARQAATANVVDAGVIAGAPYYIEIPAKWNKGLVIHTHGYTPEGGKPPAHDSQAYKHFARSFCRAGSRSRHPATAGKDGR